MNARILAFPIATALIAACDGTSPTDPSVRLCHDDTTHIEVRFPDGSVAHDLMIQHDQTEHCRKAA
jgi:hypothetical protein